MAGFKFPTSVLNQIDECSKGGFILFTINGEGDPVVFSKFDDSTSALALQYYAKNWTEVIHEINNKATFSNIASTMEEQEREQEEEDEKTDDSFIDSDEDDDGFLI